MRGMKRAGLGRWRNLVIVGGVLVLVFPWSMAFLGTLTDIDKCYIMQNVMAYEIRSSQCLWQK